MPLPDRPVAAAEIETAWGQAIHDWTFAPVGAHVSGGVVTINNSTQTTLPLDTALDDPGGWLDAANDRLEVPTGGGGLYVIYCEILTDNGSDDTQVRAFLKVNGAEIGRALEDCEGGVATTLNLSAMGLFAAGDLVQVKAKRRGSTPNPDCNIVALHVVRVGNEYGAP